MLLRPLVLLLLLGFAATASGQSATTFPRIDRAASRADIAPGGSGRLVFDVMVAASASAVTVPAQPADDLAAFGEYTFTPDAGSRCAAPTIVDPAERTPIGFAIGSVVAGTTVRCAYTVTRAAASRRDLALGLCPLSPFATCGERIEFGTRPDLALSVEQTGTAGLLRVRVSNASARDVSSAIFATECTEFVTLIGLGPAPFDVVGNFPGGCGAAPRTAVACLSFLGGNADSRGFALGPIPANASASCLVRLVPANGQPVRPGPLAIELFGAQSTRFGVQFGFTDGGSGFDLVAANNVAALGLQQLAASVPASGTTALALLVLALVLFAWRRLAAA